MAGKEDNFTSRVFCIHKTFRNIKPKLEIFSEVICFLPPGDESFYQKLESDMKVKYIYFYVTPLKNDPLCFCLSLCLFILIFTLTISKEDYILVDSIIS